MWKRGSWTAKTLSWRRRVRCCDLAGWSIYFPDQHKALTGMHRALKPGGTVAAIVYSTPENNRFFSLPVSIIRRRAQLAPPLPGQPGPFSLGSPAVLEEAYRMAGFHDVQTRCVAAPLRLPAAAECARFERESFGALHQMMAGLMSENARPRGKKLPKRWSSTRTQPGLKGPCELLICVGIK